MHNVFLLYKLYTDKTKLNNRRVGHGIGIIFTPELMKKYRADDIGFEVCPISNQVLA